MRPSRHRFAHRATGILVVLHRAGRRLYHAIGLRRVHSRRDHRTAQVRPAVLPDLLPFRLALPAAPRSSAHSALHRGALQPGGTRLSRRSSARAAQRRRTQSRCRPRHGPHRGTATPRRRPQSRARNEGDQIPAAQTGAEHSRHASRAMGGARPIGVAVDR